MRFVSLSSVSTSHTPLINLSITIFPSKAIHLLGLEYTTVPHLSIPEGGHCLLNTTLGERELHGDRLNTMQRGESQHAAVNSASSDNRALNSNALGDESHVVDSKVVIGNGHGEDDSVVVENREHELPVGHDRSGDKESVNRAADADLRLALHGDELLCAELHGLVLLALGSGEDDDVATHLGGVLDGQVAETANTHDTDAVGGLDVVGVQGVEDGGSTTHQGCGFGVGELIGNLEDEGLALDGVGSKAALVEVGHAVHLALAAVGFLACEALVAATTGVVFVSPPDAVALLQVLHVGSKLFYDTDTLVAEGHVGTLVVLIGSAETGGGYFDEDLVVLEVGLGGLRLDDLALLGALVDGERRHLGGVL